MIEMLNDEDSSRYYQGIPDGESCVVLSCGYLAHDSMKYLIRRAKQKLADVDFDTMAGTGLSGSLVIPMLAEALGKHWIVFRKGESCHTSLGGEGRLGRRWIFVDDFISSGKTQERVKELVQRVCKDSEWESVYVGTWEYKYSVFHVWS